MNELKLSLSLLVGFAIMAIAGCSTNEETPLDFFSRQESPESAYKWKSLVDEELASLRVDVDALKEPIVRSVEIIDGNGVTITPCSYSPQPSTMQEQLALSVQEAVSAQGDGIMQSIDDLQSQVEELSVKPTIRQSPVQTYSGPKTYGATRHAGYKTIQKTRRVSRVVYDEVPYEEKVPVMKRPVYQTQQEQVPYNVTKTRYRTETRQRTKTVMVPQQVTEDYTVEVPETYTETAYRTVSRRVQVAEEEVAVPIRQECIECQPVSSPATQCIECQPKPVQYRSAQPECIECQPVTYNSAPIFSECINCQPTRSIYRSSPPMPTFEVSPMPTEVPIYNEPFQQVMPSFSVPPPAQSQGLVVRTPVVTSAPRARPWVTARQTFSATRQLNGGGLFQGGKQPVCTGGQCNR